MSYKALLFDIEGTITSISFVKDVLFPYAAQNVNKYLTKHLNSEVDSKLAEIVASIQETSVKEAEFDKNILIPRIEHQVEDFTHNLLHWIKLDKKLTCLKALQGLMWEEAYASGEVKGHLFDEVVPFFEKKVKLGIPIYIYSSGSVYAQKLLFGNSIAGDITNLLSGYFDTNVGHKGSSDSYVRICSDINQNPKDVLFLTDIPAEAIAASNAGLQTTILARPGNAVLDEEIFQKFRVIKTLEEIDA